MSPSMPPPPVDDLMSRAPFTVGRSLSMAGAMYARHFVPFTLVMLALSAPYILYGVILFSGEFTAADVDTFDTAERFKGLIDLLGTGVITLMGFQALSRRPVTLSRAVGVTMQRFLPIVGASIAVTVIVLIGTFLLVIPGLIAATVLWVTIPALICEELGVTDSISRSQRLVEGYGWQVFAIVLLLGLIGFGVNSVVTELGANGVMSFPVLVVVLYAVQSVLAAFTAATTVVVYSELRRDKEGVDSDELLDVFE